MSNLLTENDSHHLFNAAMEVIELSTAFEIVKGAGAKLGVDGDQYYYGIGNPAAPDGVYGYGKTPREALQKFSTAYYSQTINPSK